MERRICCQSGKIVSPRPSRVMAAPAHSITYRRRLSAVTRFIAVLAAFTATVYGLLFCAGTGGYSEVFGFGAAAEAVRNTVREHEALAVFFGMETGAGMDDTAVSVGAVGGDAVQG